MKKKKKNFDFSKNIQKLNKGTKSIVNVRLITGIMCCVKCNFKMRKLIIITKRKYNFLIIIKTQQNNLEETAYLLCKFFLSKNLNCKIN